jgi:hypothetical protein
VVEALSVEVMIFRWKIIAKNAKATKLKAHATANEPEEHEGG